MKKSELRQLIREEIKRLNEYHLFINKEPENWSSYVKTTKKEQTDMYNHFLEKYLKPLAKDLSKKLGIPEESILVYIWSFSPNRGRSGTIQNVKIRALVKIPSDGTEITKPSKKIPLIKKTNFGGPGSTLDIGSSGIELMEDDDVDDENAALDWYVKARKSNVTSVIKSMQDKINKEDPDFLSKAKETFYTPPAYQKGGKPGKKIFI